MKLKRRSMRKRWWSGDAAFTAADTAWDAGDDVQAFRLLIQAAARGEGGLCNSIGFYYDHGIGVRCNRRKAMFWYRRAASEREAVAYINLALCHREAGRYEAAEKWYRRAIRGGDGSAALGLAKLHLEQGLTKSALALLYTARSLGQLCEDDEDEIEALLNSLATGPVGTRTEAFR
jgi:TPR repeat protein